VGLYSKSHPYRRKGGHVARCACCATCTPAGSTGWVEIHVEGEAVSYRSGQSLGQVTAQMAEVMKVCDNLEPALIPLAHRTCAEAAAAALAVGKRLQGQELASQLQPMPSLCSTPTQAAAQPGPAHAPCPHHLPDHHPSQSQLQGLLHLPGLSILTRPATNLVTSPAEEQQPIIHTTEEQDQQTMPPSMPKQQQDWATARPFSTSQLAALPGDQGPGTPAPLQQGAIHFEVNTPAYSMPSASMQPLIQPQPQPQHEPSPSPNPSPHPNPHASPCPCPHSSPNPSPRHHLSPHHSPRTSPHPSPPGCPSPCPCPSCSPSPDPCPWHDQNLACLQAISPAERRKRGSAAGPRDKHTERMGQEVVEVFGRCGSADQQAQLLDRVLTSPQLPVAVQQAMQQCPTTKQRVACLLLDRVQLLMDSGTCGKKGGQHTDDVTARKVLARLVPPELLEQQLVSAFAQQTGLDRHWVSEAARQNLEQRASIEDHPACVSASARLSG
ncbi:hypothetical protein QJQ45_027014, partial [Haematococcus lacustris]